MVRRIPVSGAQLWPAQLNCSLDILYRFTESDAKSTRELGRPKFTPEIAS
jgi:hypothetical protein